MATFPCLRAAAPEATTMSPHERAAINPNASDLQDVLLLYRSSGGVLIGDSRVYQKGEHTSGYKTPAFRLETHGLLVFKRVHERRVSTIRGRGGITNPLDVGQGAAIRPRRYAGPRHPARSERFSAHGFLLFLVISRFPRKRPSNVPLPPLHRHQCVRMLALLCPA